MSASTPQNTSRATSSFAGKDFSNNLLSDLAPLLTLFGEQVTKQFLSMSMGWADNLLIALGPLGIMTILVSTIRVGGTQRLKALVGRARESRATAEAELLSSTSEEVCEMWNGQEVVRTFGSPQTSHLVLILDSDRVKAFSLQEAYIRRVLVEASGRRIKFSGLDSDLAFGSAPNLSLNAPESEISDAERWWWVSMGLTSQLTALSAPFLVMRTAGYPILPYGYTCYLVGTIVLSSGLALCSHIIEGSTTEFDLVPNTTQNRGLRIITIQRQSSVAEQRFSSYVSLSPPGRSQIRISRLNGRNYKKLCTMSVLASLGGFIIQFLGLRAVHWSITVITLGLTVAMTSVRAWVRRGMTSHEDYLKLSNGCEGIEVSTWIEDHTEKVGKRSIAELKLPRRTVTYDRHVGWRATPARLLTATLCHRRRRPSDGILCSNSSLTFRPDLPATAYTESTPTIGQLDLCADIGIKPTTAVEELALQLISAIEALADHVTLSNNLSDSGLIRIVWDMLIVKTFPGFVHPCDSPRPEIKQMPQKRSLFLQRREFPLRNGKMWGLITGNRWNRKDLATLIELDAYARKPCGDSSRIIGSILMNKEMPWDPPSPGVEFTRWLGFVVDNPGFDTPPAASKNSEEIHVSIPIYGCQYSGSWRAAIGDEKFARLAAETGYSYVDLCITSRSSDDKNHLECALEIFYVYMLALASHMRPISSEKLYVERPATPTGPLMWRDSTPLQRHPETEEMVDVLTSTAPRLFPNKDKARQMLIPALVYHDLLP